MKRRILLALTMLILLALTGCCLHHEWQEADCVNPRICIHCGDIRGIPLPHQWTDATCTRAQECELCGQIAGTPLGHNWLEADCVNPQICMNCGESRGAPLSHQWTDATCTTGRVCTNCGEESSSALGHQWMAATYQAPQTCARCGATVGTKLLVNSVYINNLQYLRKYGKVYYHDNYYASYPNNTDWHDLYTPGHIQGPVRDGYGNTFTYGIHMDGDQLGPYYITYDLGGKYTTFSGWCILPDYKAGKSDASVYSKYFEIYCDGKLVFTSNVMRNGSISQYFEIDVTGVEILTIQYAATQGSNDLALLCDGLLS
jgi:hypothetical protein